MTESTTSMEAQSQPPPIYPTSENVSTSQPQVEDRTTADLRAKIATVARYANRIVDDIIKPSIKAFLETCDTNPRIAAIVATPALLAFLLVIAFLQVVLSASVLVVWSIFTISAGVLFVIVGGLLSLAFKLVMVLLATIPLAGMATGLLVAANSASKFIISKIPNGGTVTTGALPQSLREVEWSTIVDGATTLGTYASHGIKEAGPVLLYMRDVSVTLATAVYSAFETAKTALNTQQAGESGPNNINSQTVATEPGDVTTPAAEDYAGPGNLSRRTPYQTPVDDDPLVVD